MVESGLKLREFLDNRWLVFVASMWVQSCSGIGYLFGSLSPIIKKTMGYNQRQIAILGIAKDLGDAIGYVAGTLSEILPIWAVLAIGVVQNFVGYGLVGLIVSQILPTAPLWVLCILIFVGTNGETYFNTGSLVTCIQNFPEYRGPIVGILKGFAGLSGAIMTQIYIMINLPNEAALIFVVAVGPSMVITALMFILKPVGGQRQVRPSDNASFAFVYSVCLVLAAYLLGVLLLQDLVNLNENIITVMSVGLIFIILLPIVIPVLLVFTSKPISSAEESLLPAPESQPSISSEQSQTKDMGASEIDSLLEVERQKRIIHSAGAVSVHQKKAPSIGEDFTLTQAFKTADFWLVFISLVLASGSGMTVIDNLGQMSQSLGYENTHVFVSMISIWNFLGRVAGGYFSEIVVRKYAYPRPVAMAVVQVLMAIALCFYSLGLPGAIYVVSVLMGLGYGAHWAIVPAAASELFGLKSFGALYNFLTLSSPAGSLFFSGVIAAGIYDSEAKKQASIIPSQNLEHMLRMPLGEEESLNCYGTICYSITCGILTVLCLIASVLSLIVVYRTKKVYAKLYGNSRQ
ncbi:hypothetical protein ACET3Z_007556 [Daucus carota]